MKLTPDQVKAVPHFVAGKKGKEIAELVGVTPQTVSAWRQDAAFVAYINRLQLEDLEKVRHEIRALASEAVKELTHLLKNAENEEVKRKTIMNILEIDGFVDPQSGKFGWGIGSLTQHGVEMEMLDKKIHG